MGLDMYLYAEKFYSSASWSKEEDKKEVNAIAKMMNAENLLFSDEEDNIQFAKLKLEIAYWRKANAIHKFFVNTCADGVDNCQETYVSVENLQELLSRCKEVLENRDIASELLPTQDGFFFGSTEYDDWYFQDLERTMKILEKIIPEIEAHFDWEIYYLASW
jgi:predicted methyltransferase